METRRKFREINPIGAVNCQATRQKTTSKYPRGEGKTINEGPTRKRRRKNYFVTIPSLNKNTGKRRKFAEIIKLGIFRKKAMHLELIMF